MTNTFPSTEKYGLISQINRAAVSVPTNLAEGAARQGIKSFKYFIQVSQGSLSELDTLLELSRLLGYLNQSKCDHLCQLINEVSSLLFGLSRSLASK